jgi:hypothetical protein
MHSALKDNWAAMPVHELAVRVGRYFLNTPYSPSTLEVRDPEELVINLRHMDCFTFIENVIVLTRVIRDKSTNFETFAATLQKVRYRGGIIGAYSSRLHYFSDWFYDNQLKGFIFDLTKDMGGSPCKKGINFMTRHPELYVPLQTADQCSAMLLIEEELRSRSHYRIRKNDLIDCLASIKNGDVLAITTSQAGLDVTHTALAVYHEGKLRLLHASKNEGKVIISEQTLPEYLDVKRDRTGIMVGRIL